jgi:hypothetical protein
MKQKPILIIIGLAIIAGIIITLVIASVNKQQSLPASEQQSLTTELSLLGQNFFNNLTEKKYQEATLNFNSQMRQEMPPQELENIHNQITQKVGSLTTLGDPSLSKQDDNLVLEYIASFEREANVTIRLIFNEEPGGYQIAGLWFDSPKL